MLNFQTKSYENGVNLLASEVGLVTRTAQIPQTMGVSQSDGSKWVAAGTVFPANDSTATGIVWHDVDVTLGDQIAPIIVAGRLYGDRLPAAVTDSALTPLKASGLVFENAYDRYTAQPVAIAGIEQVGGAAGTTDSTGIKITFDVPVAGLTADKITLGAGTGSATKGTLTGSGKNWTLAISDPTQGTVNLTISGLAGYKFPSTATSVEIYAA